MMSALIVNPLQARTPETEAPGASAEELKILSWNIYMLPYFSLFNGNGRRAEVIGDQLISSDYQIIVFQEAFSSKCRAILQKKLAEKYPYRYGPANPTQWPHRTNSGLWVLSKVPLTQLGAIRFRLAKGIDMVAHKGAVLFEGKYNGSCFQLLATHLQADNVPGVRQIQCREIHGLLETHSRPEVPQLLCGDFNVAMSDGRSYRQMLQTLDAQNGELSGQLKVTYDEINNNLAHKKGGSSEILDYILTRNSHLIDKIERRISEFYHHEPSFCSHLSDHYAMEVSVRFAAWLGYPDGSVKPKNEIAEISIFEHNPRLSFK